MEKKDKEPEENILTDECESLLAEWSEKASCYRWLHGRCEKSYRTWYYCFSIPVIILSTLTGAANVGMDSFVPAEDKSMASAIVGGVNIFAGIVSTLQNFLKVAELMEGHRIAGVSWGKLQRNIAIELALDPSRRVLQSDFLKLSRAEYDRLIEAGPIVDDGVISEFNKKFKNYEVSVPSICNGLDKCNIYKIDKSIQMNKDDFIEGIEDLVSVEEKNITEGFKESLNIVKIDPLEENIKTTVIDIQENQKEDIPTINNKKEDSTVDDKKEDSTVDDKKEGSTVDDKKEDSTVDDDKKEDDCKKGDGCKKVCTCQENGKEEEVTNEQPEDDKSPQEDINETVSFLEGIDDDETKVE